ncbi:GAP family protein [Streptomyces sp. AB3(2024)]|uniref:GAP family protein n=1 Tax=Streptomyces sp. AB3(2024) TaxID=3317321 RepID=UPI0035A3BD2B
MALDLLVIGTAITLGPLHNSAFILLISSRRGVRKGLAFLLSWLVNLVVIITCVLLLTGGEPPARHTAPSTAAACVKLAIGLGLVLYGAYRRCRPPRPHGPPRWTAKVDGASLATAAWPGCHSLGRWSVPTPRRSSPRTSRPSPTGSY